MDDAIGLIQSYLLDQRGGAERLDRARVEAWTPADPPLWVHMDLAAQGAHDWLASATELKPWIVEVLTTRDARPRTVILEAGVLVVLRGVNLNPGRDPASMIPLAIWADQHRLVTLRTEALASITALRVSLETGEGPRSIDQAVVFLIDALETRAAEVIAALDEELDRLADDESSSARIDERLADLRRDLVRLRRFLAPQRGAIDALAERSPTSFADDSVVALRELADRYTRLVEELDSLREEASLVHDERTGRAAGLSAGRLYVLSIITAIFLPLSLITGLLGMNVAGIPGESWPHAFAGVTAGLAIFAVVALAALRWKRWL